MSLAQAARTTSNSLSLAGTQDRRALTQYQADLARLIAEEDARSRGAAPKAAPEATPAATGVAGCKLFDADAYRSTAQDCTACHALHSTHPVDFDYAAGTARSRGELRSAAEVVRRGVFLPDGQVRCVSCHDARSRWAHRLAIPPGAGVRPSVNVADPSTYERRVASTDGRGLSDGTSVSPTPLCKVCHTLGD
ncbi:hypothetical protein AMYX_18110 [Anaeromyxobacter diazotrophicus]|uniref:Doubled CXXCH motif domain-containing protein n=1 Tax=Anaeromyxobacter diazotrophicus TaxID=2590199 RepID=A0A7I9VLR8_9BACT|nr:hypothetical protein AMYX_18110 [Anaeromyxobacter diazotrophicus]